MRALHPRTAVGARRAGVGAAPEASDEALVALVAHADARAFEALYRRYGREVYVLAAHLLGSARSEDVVQEVFTSLWRHAHRYDPGRAPFRVWFMTMARNRVIDELRGRRAERLLVLLDPVDDLLAEAPDARVDVAEQVARRAEGDGVLRALGSLPPEQRRVLVLAYFGGLSHAAIAEELGWPLGTVKKRLQLGLGKLRAALDGDADGDRQR
jgi:RNA polymerase sigma-70 factor (ECF subfamily)